MKHAPMILCIELNKNTHTFQKFCNTPMYTTKGYLGTLMMWLSLVPFVTNGTYGHDHGWKKLMCRMKQSLVVNVVVT
jgi:hypothetical protein